MADICICPKCGYEWDEKDTAKRLAVYLNEKRITDFPWGTSYREVVQITKALPNSKVVTETYQKSTGKTIRISAYPPIRPGN